MMAGYSYLTVNNSNNSTNQKNSRFISHNHNHSNHYSFSSSSSSKNRFDHNNHKNRHNRDHRSSLSSTKANTINKYKVIKNKNRLKMNSFQFNEREKYKKLLMEHLNVSSTAIRSATLPSSYRNSFLNHQPLHKHQSNESAIKSYDSYHANNSINYSSKSYSSLYDLVESKGFHAEPVKANDYLIQQHRINDNSQCKPSSSTSRSNLIDNLWKLPEKSSNFKSLIENKFSLIYDRNKRSSTSSLSNENLTKNDDNKMTKNDLQIFEKLNNIKIFKNDRETITSIIKSTFKPFITYNFYHKFKRFIPFLNNDYQISDEVLKTIEKNEVQIEESATKSLTPSTTYIISLLTDEIEDELNAILHSKHDQLLVSAYSISIHTKDLITLYGCNWLNDAVIEFYLNLIMTRSKNEPKKYPSVYAFSTYFFTRLSNGNGPGRWANKLDFFSYNLLLIPIHHSSHWRLAVVDNDKQSIEYYDSLGNEFRYCIDLLVNFLQQESIKKKNIELNLNEWKLHYQMKNIPKQKNYYDCGVFTCKYAEYISRRAPITFNQEHIPAFRKLMMYEIIHQQLLV